MRISGEAGEGPDSGSAEPAPAGLQCVRQRLAGGDPGFCTEFLVISQSAAAKVFTECLDPPSVLFLQESWPGYLLGPSGSEIWSQDLGAEASGTRSHPSTLGPGSPRLGEEMSWAREARRWGSALHSSVSFPAQGRGGGMNDLVLGATA